MLCCCGVRRNQSWLTKACIGFKIVLFFLSYVGEINTSRDGMGVSLFLVDCRDINRSCANENTPEV